MYAMGILALGDALSGLSGEPVFRMIGFWVGAPLAVVTYLTQLREFHGPSQFSWGLPLVGPMVSASTAGALSRDFGQFFQVTGTVLFLMSILTAVPTFAYVYWSYWRGQVPLEGATSATAWVRLTLLNGSQWLDVVALSIPVLLIAHWGICAARFVSWTISSRHPT